MPEEPDPAAMRAVVEQQLERFRAKFGREPADDEPLFFDPGADEPRPLSHEQIAGGFEKVRHRFSADEVATFERLVLGRDDTSAEDVEDDDGPGLDGLVSSLGDSFEGVVAATLREPGPEPVLNIAARLQNTITDDEAGQLVSVAVLAVLTGWLSAARERGVDAEAAMDWILAHLGVRDAARINPVSGLIGYAKAPRVSMEEAADQLGPSLVPSLLYLACAIAATSGGNDAHWLRQFDLTDLTV